MLDWRAFCYSDVDFFCCICFVGIARASARTDENGHDILYAQPILNDEMKARIPCRCSSHRCAFDLFCPHDFIQCVFEQFLGTNKVAFVMKSQNK